MTEVVKLSRISTTTYKESWKKDNNTNIAKHSKQIKKPPRSVKETSMRQSEYRSLSHKGLKVKRETPYCTKHALNAKIMKISRIPILQEYAWKTLARIHQRTTKILYRNIIRQELRNHSTRHNMGALTRVSRWNKS